MRCSGCGPPCPAGKPDCSSSSTTTSSSSGSSSSSSTTRVAVDEASYLKGWGRQYDTADRGSVRCSGCGPPGPADRPDCSSSSTTTTSSSGSSSSSSSSTTRVAVDEASYLKGWGRQYDTADRGSVRCSGCGPPGPADRPGRRRDCCRRELCRRSPRCPGTQRTPCHFSPPESNNNNGFGWMWL